MGRGVFLMINLRKHSIRSLVLPVLLGGLIILTVPQSAVAAEPGEAAYAFLNIGADARAEALGGAYTAAARGVEGVFYNPAGLAQAQAGQYVATYTNWITDIQSGALAVVFRERGTIFAVSAQYLDFGTFDGFTPSGSPSGDFGASDLALALHGAGYFTPDLAWGVGGRFISESIDDESSAAFAFDGGLQFQLRDQRTRFGVAVRNLGIQTSSFGTEKDDLPLLASVGLTHKLRGAPVRFAADIFKPGDDDLALEGGLEYTGLENLALRVGYNTLNGSIDTDSDSDNLAGFAFGAGFSLNRYTIDYAFGAYSALGDAHRFTLRSGF
jgi:hypothetical protein